MVIISISDWFTFIGRFHPLMVHLPIGFFSILVVIETLNSYNYLEVHKKVIQVIIFCSTLSAISSCILGYFLSLEGGYNEEILVEHQNQGIVFSVLNLLMFCLKLDYSEIRIPFSKRIYDVLLLFTTLMMIITGHHGGNLTHGEDYLTEKLPFNKKNNESIVALSNSTKNLDKNTIIVYKDIIKPIFKQKCEQCHNASKMKGNLRMDEVSFFKKGGKHGEIFKANDAEGSEFIKRILLPESNDEHMPPKGKPQITEDELNLLRWWIQEGASFDKKFVEFAIGNEINQSLSSLGFLFSDENKRNARNNQTGFILEEKILNEPITTINESLIQKIKESGGLVLPISQNKNYVEISFVNNKNLNDENIQSILGAEKQTIWLKLSNTKITDNAGAVIEKMTNTTRLNLFNTKVTDKILTIIQKLPKLEYLNLVGTGVSDAGLNSIIQMKNLKKLYIWNTKITDEGLNKIKNNLPNLDIENGITEKMKIDYLNLKQNEVSDDVYKKKD